MLWTPGSNVPALHRGTGGDLGTAAFQILGNVLWHCHHNCKRLHSLADLFGIVGQRGPDAAAVVAELSGVNVKTVRRVQTCLAKNGWSAGQLCPMMPRSRKRRRANAAAAAPATAAAAAVAVATVDDIIPVTVGDSVPVTVGAGDSVPATVGDRVPSSLLAKWERHPNFKIGLRMAELATFWTTSNLPVSKFVSFLTWASCHFPGAFGAVNHSKHFVDDFSGSLLRVTCSLLAGSLHTLVPATGMPSNLTRVVDVITINGVSFLPTLHIYTNHCGVLAHALLGCPALGSSGSPAPAGGETFHLHGGAKLVALVHELESKFRIARGDRCLRLALNVADNAIEGPGSVSFSEHEARADQTQHAEWKAAACEFHSIDRGGASVDRCFQETDAADELWRLVREKFAWGTGRLILKAVATEHARLASRLRDSADQCGAAIAKAEAEGRTLAAARLRVDQARDHAHAAALKRAGWCEWKQPLAPRADSTLLQRFVPCFGSASSFVCFSFSLLRFSF